MIRGKVLYGALFCVVLPTLLVVWARAASSNVALAAPRWDYAAWAGIAAGAGLIVAATIQLWVEGGGVPMNAYPPPRLAERGAYRLLRHPIYVGAVLLSAGIAVLTRSSGGSFLVTPALAAGCVALVLGYEGIDLRRRFGRNRRDVILGIPAAGDGSPTFVERLGAAVTVFLPWLVLYETVVGVGVLPEMIDTVLPFERRWPVFEWATPLYLLAYPLAILAPFASRTRSDLRDFVTTGAWTTGLGIFSQIVFPLYASPRPFAPGGTLGQLLLLDRMHDGPAAAFPSFHVAWALVAAAAYDRRFPRLRPLWITLSLGVSVACVLTGAHSLADVAAGALLYAAVRYRTTIWRAFAGACERVANSWRERRVGYVRWINHGMYAGFAALAGILVAGLFLADARALSLVTLCTIAGGALWGQLVEGSPRLLRPYGYYGAILGGVVGIVAASVVFDSSLLVSATAFALAAPWVQAIGRLRCLVQGCCHGAVVEGGRGVRYFHERSRVSAISGLRGQALHNTQGYSIVSNAAIGLLLARLWYGGAPLALILGGYFLLAGMARFVEEAYRGEVQTKIVGRLRSYQWLAIASVIAGAALTAIPSGVEMPAVPPSAPRLAVACGAAVFAALAMGMDFPRWNARFARLSR